jgi:hypothetical protein
MREAVKKAHTQYVFGEKTLKIGNRIVRLETVHPKWSSEKEVTKLVIFPFNLLFSKREGLRLAK